jgi:NAD(P)-dependent dehydrogenase (short-subunit alcohol dehydrogenase family)
MKIVVIGGTGLIGSKTVAILRQSGHEVVAAAPNTGGATPRTLAACAQEARAQLRGLAEPRPMPRRAPSAGSGLAATAHGGNAGLTSGFEPETARSQVSCSTSLS